MMFDNERPVRPSMLPALREANAECHRAAARWAQLRDSLLADVLTDLGEKEIRHLEQTVYRINLLVFLYSYMRRIQHSTELGTLLGAITHLLDYVYDHGDFPAEKLHSFERAITTEHPPEFEDRLELALSVLGGRLRSLVGNPDSVANRLADGLDTQRDSLAQGYDERLSESALRRITWDKGHRSLCLYFAAVDPDFSETEALALRSLGGYMQYMDDLEDLYEDRTEGRQSPVPGITGGIFESTRLCWRARRDLRSLCRRDQARYDYRMFCTCLVLFHIGMLTGVLLREVTLRLPPRVQATFAKHKGRLADRVPFLRIVPLSLVIDPNVR
jgi:hypothetical protein